MTKTQKLKIILAFCSLLFTATPVFAAEISFAPENKEARLKTEFQVAIFLNTKGENINAVEGILRFPTDILELKEINDGNSIINFWIERPSLNRDGRIAFAGITPGGFLGEQGLLFSVTFLAKENGVGQVEMQEIKALLNDGQGTATDISAPLLDISVTDTAFSLPIEEIKDQELPESFAPEIARDPELFDGQWFLVFATQDKKSGIDRYKVKETRQKAFAFLSRWIPAESPYQLQDQSLESYILIKAIDKEGNERIMEIGPKNPLPWNENYFVLAILILIIAMGAIIAYLIRKFLWKKRAEE